MFGFDIGTWQSEVAYTDQAGKPVITLNNRGETATRSAVWKPETGKVLIGTDATEQSVVDPSGYVSDFKLQLGSTESLLPDTPFTATDATVQVIGALKGDVERQSGVAVESAVFTCPANFLDNQKQALIEAAERNGIQVLRVVPEPTAAGYAYALEKGVGKMTMAVYDLGGGTFDVSILEKDGPQVTVRATEGIRELGGNAFNRCLLERVLKDVEANTGERPSSESDPLAFFLLARAIEAAKISLNAQAEVPIVTSFKGREVITMLRQAEFHEDIRKLLQQSLDAFDRAVAAASLTPDKLDRVIMIGAASRSPFVQEMVADHTGFVPKTDIDPDKAVAYGAALASLSELALQGKTAILHGRSIPSPELFCRDITAHGVGCCVAEGSGSKQRLLNDVIIPKNTPIPCRLIKQFYLEHEDVQQARIEILQGEDDADREECLLIGELILDNLPKEHTRTRRIQVEFALDANGMVTVTATDKVSETQQTVSVDYKKGICPKDKPEAA